ncbi:MAG TPA: gluconate 2-dehydrogenase subunit 3 family protein [Terriglobales bacterium]|nr:gluconate 2-dehydrogenase subunit 3 family protein [Terriglobales bacterium]
MNSDPRLPIVSSSTTASAALTRREVLQRILAGLGATFAAPLAAAHPMARHLANPSLLQTAATTTEDTNWSPQFLSAKQNDALIVISERMLPGANAAHVNRVIDLLLSAETDDNRKMFAAALTALDGEATKRFQAGVTVISATQLDEVLSASAAQEPPHSEHDDDAPGWKLNLKTAATAPPNLRDHFENLKGWIVATYYSSEAGLRELGWNDDFYFESPEECAHPEGHS